MERDLLSTLESPAAAVCSGTLCAIPTAGDRIRSCSCRTIPHDHMCLRQMIRIVHLKTAPATEYDMQIFRQLVSTRLRPQKLIDKVKLFRKTEYLTMRIAPRDHDHLRQISHIDDITRYVETKKSRQHNRCLDFSPICIRIALQNLQIVLIGGSNVWP